MNIEKKIKKIDYSTIYKSLCNQYEDIDKGGKFTKDVVKKILEDIDFTLKFSAQEKIFFNDYFFNDFIVRFILSYQYGFIDCSYIIYNDECTIFRGGLGDLCKLVDNSFEDKVKYKFPTATNIHELQDIIMRIWQLHTNFIAEFEKG